MIYAVSVLVSFIAVLLKVFQQKNVVGHHFKTMAVTSYCMATFDVAAVTIIVHGGWWVVLTSGTGAAIGAVRGVLLHRKLFDT